MPRARPKVYVVVPAAGEGKRMGGEVRKQFFLLHGKPVVIHTLQQFEHSPDVDEIAVAIPESAVADMENLVNRYRLHKVSKVVAGGSRRQDSVYNVLRKLPVRDSDIVLVHDGVRPFVDSAQILQAVKACREYGAAVFAVQPKDTLRRSRGGDFFEETVDRSALWLIQTPQAFRASLLTRAYESALKERFSATDEAALVERIGVRARILHGSYDNIKITTKEDLELAALIFSRRERSANR